MTRVVVIDDGTVMEKMWARLMVSLRVAQTPVSKAMNARTSANSHADARSARCWALIIIVAVVVGASALRAILHGSAIRERAEQLKAALIAEEDRALCERLGMPHDSDRFAACAGALSETRQREAERIATASAGIL
jgi:hypothetical protein